MIHTDTVCNTFFAISILVGHNDKDIWDTMIFIYMLLHSSSPTPYTKLEGRPSPPAQSSPHAYTIYPIYTIYTWVDPSPPKPQQQPSYYKMRTPFPPFSGGRHPSPPPTITKYVQHLHHFYLGRGGHPSSPSTTYHHQHMRTQFTPCTQYTPRCTALPPSTNNYEHMHTLLTPFTLGGTPLFSPAALTILTP